MPYAGCPSMKISNPVTCEQLLRPKINFDREEVWCIALSNQCDLLEYKRLGRGDLSQVPLNYRKVLKFALKAGAEQIILLHSHTDKCSFPSDADLFWTEKIKKLMELLNLKLSDHIIISRNDFTSLLQHDSQLFE